MEEIVYYILVLILTYYVIRKCDLVGYQSTGPQGGGKIHLAAFIAVFLALLFGLMPLTGYYTGDRWNLVSWFVLYRGNSISFSWEEKNFLFQYFYSYVASHNLPPSVLFLPMSIIYFGGILWACRKIFENNVLIAFVVYLGALSTLAYCVNGAKAGTAAALFLVAIAYRENLIIASLFCFLSLGCHHSMFLPIVVFALTFFVKNPKYYLYGWLAACVIAAAGITYFQTLLADFSNDKGARYLRITNEVQKVSGFRPDFILYSAIPIFLGYYFHNKFNLKSDTYNFLLNLYTGTNMFFILCSNGVFINRIAYLSWLMYPIVLIYPFLKFDLGNNHYRYLKYAVFGNFGFTFLMWIIG